MSLSRVKPLVLPAIFILLGIIALMSLNLTWALVAVIVLSITYVLIDASFNRIIFKMSLRNVVRRKGTTALVLGGLMVGTAIISASLVVGDTMDNMVVGEVARGMGDIDFLVGNKAGGSQYMNVSSLQAFRQEALGIEHVTAAEPFITTTSGVWDTTSNLRTPSATVIGLTPGLLENFGGLLEVDGDNVSYPPSLGTALVNERLAALLDIRAGDHLELGQGASSLELIVMGIVENEGLGAYGGNDIVFVNEPNAQTLSGKPGQLNFVAIAMANSGENGVGYADQVREGLNTTITAFTAEELRILRDKAKVIEDGRNGVAVFTSMFFVFGSFSIIAGIALVVNIFTMLGEERKGEMGMARAIGMQRTHLRRLLTYEGLVYAAIAAGIGTMVGLGLAYVIVASLSGSAMFGTASLVDYFTFTNLSLMLGYIAGFMLTLVTVYASTRRISNMNIVRAIRNIPEPAVSRGDKRAFRLGLMLLGVGALIMVLGIGGESLVLAMSGLSTMTISSGLLLRKFVSERIAWNVAGILTLFLWVPKGFEIFPYTANIEMFAVSGVFMVVSVLVLVMFNSDGIIRAITAVLRARGGYRAVVRTAISYPLKAKFRTALSIFIFGLVIFTVTTLSMISGVLGVGIPKMIEETSGGFDVIAFTNTVIPDDHSMWDDINTTSGLVKKENVTSIVALSQTIIRVSRDGTDPNTHQPYRPFHYQAVGVNTDLYTKGHYPLTAWNTSAYSNEEAVWQAVQSDSSKVIVDGTASAAGGGVMFGMTGLAGVKVGDSIILSDLMGNNRTVNVVGIMKQNSFQGVFVNNDYVRQDLHVGGTNLFLIKLALDLDADKQALLLENQFWNYGTSTIPMKSLAQDIVNQINSMFNLFTAFLAMGLIIGVCGLGIITIRSIHERRVEIGMMRAIGFTKRMVVTNFALESSLISLLGILVGTVLGFIVGYELYDIGFRSMGFDFVIPWEPLLIVGLGAFLATLLSVLPAARGASKVSPAEVLRFE